MRAAIQAIPKSDWRPYPNGHLAETVHTMNKNPNTFRLIVVHRRIQNLLPGLPSCIISFMMDIDFCHGGRRFSPCWTPPHRSATSIVSLVLNDYPSISVSFLAHNRKVGGYPCKRGCPCLMTAKFSGNPARGRWQDGALPKACPSLRQLSPCISSCSTLVTSQYPSTFGTSASENRLSRGYSGSARSQCLYDLP